MSIFNKNKESEFDRHEYLLEKNIKEYVEFKLNNVSSHGLDPNEIDQKDYRNRYIEAVLFVVDYLRIVFTNNKLDSNDNLEFDLNDMCNCASEETKHFIEFPKLNDIIFIVDDTISPHFHINVDNETIDEAEYIVLLSNYNCIVNNGKLCSFFKGLTVYEARDLLKQMNILPENGMFNVALQLYDEKKEIHNKYFLSIIYMLLKTNDKYDVKRARILADNLGINFDFTPYEDGKVLDSGIKKKTPPKL